MAAVPRGERGASARSDRRKAPRFGVAIAAEFLLPGQAPLSGRLSNVSDLGTLFVGQEQPNADPGMYGVVSISRTEGRMNAVARIARLAGRRGLRCEIGLEFVQPSDQTKQAIGRLQRKSRPTEPS